MLLRLRWTGSDRSTRRYSRRWPPRAPTSPWSLSSCPPSLAGRLQDSLARNGTSPVGASSLTAAELRLLPLLSTHLSYQEISERLFISKNTVKSQAYSAYRKLGVSSRSEAVVRARELGLDALSRTPTRSRWEEDRPG